MEDRTMRKVILIALSVLCIASVVYALAIPQGLKVESLQWSVKGEPGSYTRFWVYPSGTIFNTGNKTYKSLTIECSIFEYDKGQWNKIRDTESFLRNIAPGDRVKFECKPGVFFDKVYPNSKPTDRYWFRVDSIE